MFKNVASQKIAIYAYDVAARTGKTGDAANITAQISIDGGVTGATNDVNPTELDAADAPGVYIFDMTQAETNGDLIILSAVSSTSNISIEPVFIYTETVMRGTDGANTVVPDASGVAPTAAEIVNEWETQSQADPTGFHVNAMEWLSQAVTLSTGNKPDVNVDEISDDSTAAENLELAADNYSVTRGLSGTALPAVAADGAGGLPISDAGGLDLDTLFDNLISRIGTPVDIDSGGATLADNLKKIVDDNDGATFNAATDSLLELMNKVRAYFQLLARSDAAIEADMATELGEINANEGTGVGDYSSQTDSQEAIGDKTALDSVVTEARLAELDPANLPSDVDDILADTNATVAKLPTNFIMGSSDQTDKDDEIDAIKVKTDLLPEGPQKNTAFDDIKFLMVDATDFATPETGLTVTGQVSLDGGAFGAVSGSIAEIGNGIYSFDAAAGDMNGDSVAFMFSSAGAADTFITIKTTS